MKKNVLSVMPLVLFVWIAFVSTAMAKDSMTIAVHDYAPYYNNDGKGMLIDLYQAICDDAKIDVTFKVLPVKRGIEYLFDSKVDAFSPGHIFMTPEQFNQVSIIKAFNVVGVFIYYDPGNKKAVVYNSVTNLKGSKVGVIQNSPWLPEYEQVGLPVEQIQTPELLVKMLYAGRFDFIETTLLAGFTITNGLYKNEVKNFDFVVHDVIECSVAFLKSNPKGMALMDKFNASFETIKKNGEYVRVLETYWGKNNIQKEALPDDLKKYGTDKASLDVFSTYNRNAWSKIVESK